MSFKHILLLVIALIALVGGAMAVGPNAKAHDGAKVAETHPSNVTEKRQARIARLEGAKLKSCQNREASITKIMARIANRGEKQIGVFNKISERVQAFYVSKSKTLANYDELVADVNAKKASAQTAIDTVNTTSIEFKCDGSDPKGAGESFKSSQISVKSALKAYKTAVKNLIVGVKSVQGSTTSNENKSKGDAQ